MRSRSHKQRSREAFGGNAVAAQSGEVALAGETASGFIVTIDHGHREWATHYAHLSRLFVAQYLGQRSKRRQRVRAGDVIGYAAKSPLHVRFELWNWTEERGFVPVDPHVLELGPACARCRASRRDEVRAHAP